MEWAVLDWFSYGLWVVPWWVKVLITLALTHLTIVSVTIYLHRHQSHRALDLHPAVAHLFRFWLWLTTGMITKEWASVHRKHHARVETPDDPHSPQVYGLSKVLFEGAELYRVETANRETLEKFGHGTPDDWLERNLYSRHPSRGILLMFLIDFALFGSIGLTMWAVQMIWIPFFAAGVVNGVGHYWGYRNFECTDASTNIVPWGILIGGEELHNNHHAFASSARFSSQWWEFDVGWLYIRCLELLGLARVKKVAPVPQVQPGKRWVDLDTVRAVVGSYPHVMARYSRDVVKQVHKEELQRTQDRQARGMLKPSLSLLIREASRLNDQHRQHLQATLAYSLPLQTVYQFKLDLQSLWKERTATHESLLQALTTWCHQAEATGIKSLQDFAQVLRSYSPQRI